MKTIIIITCIVLPFVYNAVKPVTHVPQEVVEQQETVPSQGDYKYY